MRVQELIDKLKTIDPEKSIFPQVVDKKGNAFTCYLELTDLSSSSFCVITLSHPELEDLYNIPKRD